MATIPDRDTAQSNDSAGIEGVRLEQASLGSRQIEAGREAERRKDFALAEDHYRAARTIALSISAPKAAAKCQLSLGRVTWEQGFHTRSLELLESALAEMEAVGDAEGALNCESCIIFVAEGLLDWAAALRAIRHGLQRNQARGETAKVADGCVMAATFCEKMGDIGGAAKYYSEGAKLSQGRGRAKALANLGRLAKEQNDPRKAVVHYGQAVSTLADQRSVDIGEQADWECDLAMYRRMWSEMFSETGQEGDKKTLLNLALAGFKRAMDQFRSAGARQKAASCQRWSGLVARDQGRNSDALTLLETASAELEEAGDLIGTLQCEEDIARIAGEINDRSSALRSIQRVIRCLKASSGEDESLAEACFIAAGHCEALNDETGAEEYYAEAARLSQGRERAKALANLGRMAAAAAFKSIDPTQERHTESNHKKIPDGDLLDTALQESQVAADRAEQNIKPLRKAAEYYTDAISTLSVTPPLSNTAEHATYEYEFAEYRKRLAFVLFELGQWAPSQALLEQALATFQQVSNNEEAAQCLFQLGVIEAGCFMNYAKALERQHQARSLLAGTGDPLIRCLNQIALLHYNLGTEPGCTHYDTCIAYGREAFGLAVRTGHLTMASHAIENVAVALWGKQLYSKSIRAYRWAVALTEAASIPAETSRIASICLIAPSVLQAILESRATHVYSIDTLSGFELLLASAQQRAGSRELAALLVGLGTSHAGMREFHTAEIYFHLAAKLAEHLHRSHTAPVLWDVQDRWTFPYTALIEQVLCPTNRYTEAIQRAEDITTDTTSRILGARWRIDLRDKIKEWLMENESAGPDSRIPTDVLQMVARLEAEEPWETKSTELISETVRTLKGTNRAVLRFFCGSGKIMIAVITGTGLQGMTSAVSSHHIRRLALLWRSSSRKYGLARDADERLRELLVLDDILISAGQIMKEACANIPANIRRLVLIPHGPLHLIPWHACILGDGDTQELALNRFDEIVYAPSIRVSLYSRLLSIPVGDGLFAISNPTGDLPGADTEVSAISKLFASSKSTVARTITAQEFITRAADADVLLYAGHTMMRDGFQKAALAPGELIDWKELLSECEMPHCALADIDSCETHMFDGIGRTDDSSITASLLAAGARAVWSTQWPVDDGVASAIKRRAYENLMLHKMEPARALNEAQRAFLRGELPLDSSRLGRSRFVTTQSVLRISYRTEDYMHPVYWAPFITTG